jgi:TM2 domain-containing membrane protein YozV
MSYNMSDIHYGEESHMQGPSLEEASRLKILAGVLALVIGPLGIHKFVLGCTGAGLVMLLTSVLSFGLLAGPMAIIAMIEGIIYLTRSDRNFLESYVLQKRSWF